MSAILLEFDLKLSFAQGSSSLSLDFDPVTQGFLLFENPTVLL